MRHAQASRAAARAKSLNLSVDTNVNNRHNGTATATPSADVSTQVSNAPSSQHKFGNTEVKIKSAKPSQALANPNWRSRELGTGALLRSPTTAGLPQTEFQKGGGHEAKKPTRSVSPEDGYLVRRYRTTPVDPDFIHSAPLTKNDYRGAKLDTDDSEYDEDKDICPTDQQHGDGLGRGALVRLDPTSPNTRERFKAQNLNFQLQKQDGQWVENWRYGNSPLSAIPVQLTSPSCQDESMTFPAAKVKTVREPQRFKSGLWGDLDEQVQRQVAALNEPRTASLPFGRSQEEYENSRRPLAIASASQGPATQKMAMNDRRHEAPYQPSIPEQPEREAQRYESFIHKLNTPSDFYFAERRHIREMGDIEASSNTASNNSPAESKSLTLVHPSQKGSTGAMSADKRGKSLNPQASEFRVSGQVTRQLPSSSNQTQPTSTTNESSGNQALVGNEVQEILDSITRLREEVAELRASSSYPPHHRDTGLQQQIDHLQVMAGNIGANSSSQGQSFQSPENQAQTALVHIPQTRQGNQYGAQQGAQHGVQHGAQQGAQQYGGYIQPHPPTAPYSGLAQAQNYIPGMYDNPVVNGSAFNAPAYSSPAYNTPPYNAPVYNAPAYNGIPGSSMHGYNGPVYGSAGYAPTFPMAPAYGFGGQPNMQYPGASNANPAAFTGPVSSGNLPLPQQAQLAFGPRPVLRPRARPRMNDPNFVRHQQDYELYLELKRATDPEYARQCKDRQAKRAELQRSSRS